MTSKDSTLGDSESVFSHHESCPACGSRDNLSRYTSGWGICVCGHKDRLDAPHGDNTAPGPAHSRQHRELIQGTYRALSARGISEETCRKFHYACGLDKKGKAAQMAAYFQGNQLVAQKLRYKDKTFKFIGEPKKAGLFGQQLWGQGGKKIVITEGEIDCMTVSQLQGNKWPVVSIPYGAQSAKKGISKHIEWLETFEEVILMFDMDDPGIEAAEECAPLFSPGKCKIARLPLKDPNECLLKGQGAEVISAIWNAKLYRPDGLVGIGDLTDELSKPIEEGLPWFLPTLTRLTYGRRWGEVYGFGAGTGIGKTDVLTQQIAFDVTELRQQVGVLFLEQKPIETLKRIAGKTVGKRFHVPDGSWGQSELVEVVKALDGKLTFYDSFGATEWEQVSAKIRYMAISQGIRLFYLDHLTAMADTSDEKGSLEQIMKEMAGIANELQIIIHFVSHLTTPEGKPHEEGGHVSIRHFKGSRAIGFWSYFMFGLERNQQAEDPVERSTTTFRVLKDRYTGQATGEVIRLGYDKQSGLLSERPTEADPRGAFEGTEGVTEDDF